MPEVDLGIDGLTDAEMIGRGGFSSVYAATDTRFQRRVAVKILNADLGPNDRRRFDRECAVMGQLSGEPGVVTVYSAGYTADDRPYLIMELVTGGSMAAHLARRVRLPWRDAVQLLIPVVEAVGAAHRAGILHRDIKPENVLLDGDRPLLTDFGLANLRDSNSSTSTHLTASWLHTAPETFTGQREERSDLYSVGSTLFNLIVGHAPFWREDDDSINPLIYRLINEPAPHVPSHLAPPEVDRFIQAVLAKDPTQRPADAPTMAAAMNGLLAPGATAWGADTDQYPGSADGGPWTQLDPATSGGASGSGPTKPFTPTAAHQAPSRPGGPSPAGSPPIAPPGGTSGAGGPPIAPPGGTSGAGTPPIAPWSPPAGSGPPPHPGPGPRPSTGPRAPAPPPSPAPAGKPGFGTRAVAAVASVVVVALIASLIVVVVSGDPDPSIETGTAVEVSPRNEPAVAEDAEADLVDTAGDGGTDGIDETDPETGDRSETPAPPAGPGSDLTGTVTISGSALVAPLTDAVGNSFVALHPDVEVVGDAGGTGLGLDLFCQGQADIAAASRPIRDVEIERCAAGGVSYIELPVAIDAVALVTAADDDQIECLSLADVYAVLGPESTGFDQWSDANPLSVALGGAGNLPTSPLLISGPEPGAAAHTSILDLALAEFIDDRGESYELRSDYEVVSSDRVVFDSVTSAASNLGVVRFESTVGVEAVRPVPIAPTPSGTCVDPTLAAVTGGQYPLRQVLYLYVNRDAATGRPEVDAFVDHYLDVGLEMTAIDVGLTPLSTSQQATTRGTWAER